MHARDKEYAVPGSMRNTRGVTPIDQLINLDDEDKTRDETVNKIKTRSMIRNTGGRGGMSSYEKYYNSAPNSPSSGSSSQQMRDPETDEYMEAENEGYGQARARTRDRIFREPYTSERDGIYRGEGEYQDEPYRYHNCVDIANHAKNCPVCSKLYNNDKSIYILIIGLLAIICIILFKNKMEK